MEILRIRFYPLRKQGLETGTAIALSGGLGLAGSLFGSAANSESASENLEAQREENQKNRAFNAQQAELARQYATREREAQQQYQSQEWQRQFEAQNAYNSPAAQSQRLKSAGINPAVYFTGSQVAQGGNTSVSAPSTPSMPQAQYSGGLSPVAFPSQIPNMMSSAAQVLQALGSYEKNTSEASSTRQLIEPTIQKMLSEIGLNDVMQKYQSLMVKMEEARVPYYVRNAAAEYADKAASVFLKVKQGEKIDWEKELIDSQKKLNKALESMHGEQAAMFKAQALQITTSLPYQLALLKSESYKNNQEGALAGANKATVDALRDLQVRAQRIANQRDKQQGIKELSTLYSDIQTTLSNNKVQRQLNETQYKELQRRLQIAKKKLDARDNTAFEAIDDLINYLSSELGVALGGVAAAAIK